MFYDAVKNDHGFQYDPFKAIVVPRPIGWVSTVSPDGIANLAPYSFFNAMSDNPHYVAFGAGSGKDSQRNAEAAGEFAINLATFDLREQMNASSANVGSHVDEFELAGLTKAKCNLIAAPRVAELLADEMSGERSGEPHETLSDRELQVFLRLARGASVSDIAEHLHLSVKTISTYRSRLTEKLNVASNAELATYALRHGLIAE